MFNNMFLRLFFVKGRKYLSVPHLAYEGAEWLQQCGQVEDVHLVQGIVDRADHAEHRVQALLLIGGVKKTQRHHKEKDLSGDLCSATFFTCSSTLPLCRGPQVATRSLSISWYLVSLRERGLVEFLDFYINTFGKQTLQLFPQSFTHAH